MKNLKTPKNKILHYFLGIILIIFFMLLSHFVHKITAPYLLMVVIASLYLRTGPAVMVTILGILALDFFILPPPFQFTIDIHSYLFSFVTIVGVGLIINTLVSRIRRQDQISRQLELVHEREKLQVTLLNSISHELRTPLVSIKGALSSLSDDTSTLDENTRKELLAAAYEDTEHLNQLVGNLLDVTRLESGALRLHIKPCELRDVVGAALQSFKNKIDAGRIVVDIPRELPEIPLDFVLMMRVFINLLDNAVKYSPSDMPIKISAVLKDRAVQIDIKDHGMGIPSHDLERIFDKFYRTYETRPLAGIGLGLSICKGFVEAHRGHIWASNNEINGVTFSVALPLGHDLERKNN